MHCDGFHLSVAFVFTLLTFCPPGPLLRAVVICNSFSVSTSPEVILSASIFCRAECCLLVLVAFECVLRLAL